MTLELEDRETCLVELLDFDGTTQHGLILPFDDRLPRVIARIEQVADNDLGLKTGDVVLFPAHSASAVTMADETTYALRLDKIVAVIEGYDSPEETYVGVAQP